MSGRIANLPFGPLVCQQGGLAIAFIHLTRRELIAAAPLAVAAPTLLRAATPEPGSWRFLVVGDWGRGGSKAQVRTAQAMALVAERENTEFVVSTGDNFYNWGLWSRSDQRWDASFERVYPERLDRWYPVLGNHDYGGSVDAQIKRGGRWQMDDRWYVKKLEGSGRPSIDLLFFDTVAWQGKEKFPYTIYGSTVDAATRAAQERDMTRALASATKLKLAFGHHGIYSVGKYGGSQRMPDLDRLLRESGVKAWISGHDHCLYHIEHQGMHYVCSGAGSDVRGEYGGGPGHCALASSCDGIGEDATRQPVWRSFYRDRPGSEQHIGGGFALFEVGAASGRFQFYDNSANPLKGGQLY